ncbi:MAG: helix-turn-helix domain-containing protein [Nocardioidaceae bacterium]
MVEQRKNLGMSQTDVAKAMHNLGFRWHQVTVGRVESGVRPLRLDEGFALAGLFGIDLTTFRFDAVCQSCFNRPPAGFTCNACGGSS